MDRVMRYSRGLVFSGLALAVLLAAPPAHAISYNLSLEFSGGAVPSGSPTVSIVDAGANTVTVTMSTANLTDLDEFVGVWMFNVQDPALALTIVFDDPNSSGPAATSVDQTCTGNACKADGDGFFDLKFEFNTANSGDRFGANETVVYTITGTGLDATDFDILSAPGGGAGQYHTAAHVQGIAPNDEEKTSGWLGDGPGGPPTSVPEPGTLALVGLGLVGVGMMVRARRQGV